MRSEHPKVLVVDDDGVTAKVHAKVLENHGFDVSIVESGEQALSAVEWLQPEVILLDILLPGKDGIEVARELSSRGDACKIPIVMITGASSFPVGMGMDDIENICRFLYKPCDENALVQGINEALLLPTEGEPR